jgi:hypothetical protein
MPTLKSVESKIFRVEQFRVRFLQDHSGRGVRSDKKNLRQYDYERMAKNDYTVSQWRTARFQQQYPGFDIEVLDGSGTACHGGTKLSTARDTYLE